MKQWMSSTTAVFAKFSGVMHMFAGYNKAIHETQGRQGLYAEDFYLTLVLAFNQSPVCLAFAMTVNKSQRQSVKHVRIDLHTPVFTYDQLYVALPRATAKNQIYVLFPHVHKDSELRM
jgi:ATP-dependent exoDNAse (exonuclease V) alpha subunit